MMSRYSRKKIGKPLARLTNEGREKTQLLKLGTKEGTLLPTYRSNNDYYGILCPMYVNKLDNLDEMDKLL